MAYLVDVVIVPKNSKEQFYLLRNRSDPSSTLYCCNEAFEVSNFDEKTILEEFDIGCSSNICSFVNFVKSYGTNFAPPGTLLLRDLDYFHERKKPKEDTDKDYEKAIDYITAEIFYIIDDFLFINFYEHFDVFIGLEKRIAGKRIYYFQKELKRNQ